ncbi:hypothetical protein DICPUDRAFT_79965 [Dictyostelium purpureum]|uniref:VWFA domain-containing protein n=1 Tax=Dictyostelium purpureum TaxID=5786 RepID=F0ZP56_DICPU|nr:uncharacterized protein DICPUDRAFT_79965 [Dictyostelium purpureum]EGC34275.1 hypothetical protein DICPUDRAFT_79965 [Dictyostelium purpureum]|eukprot:XP_003289204.1 hypothetical protein DICPUDRAFT_79965 [Dictyostelium purpureum]
MLITFVVDTSGSMSQKTTNGMTLLDCCKAAIEHFIKIRSKDASMRNDRFFLITSEENSLTAVKIGWKDNFNTFIQEVKNLVCKDMSNLGFSLQKAFDNLNLFRIQSSIDNYGQGRNPWFIEPAIIVLLTDGSSLTNNMSIVENFTLPKNVLNNDPTIEPFRWDQRLFSIVLKFNGISSNKQTSLPSEPAIAPMCDVTGGMSSCYNFEPLPLQQQQKNGTLPNALHKMLYVRGQGGFWPIPENYYPDLTSLSLPARTAHPIIRYSILECDTHIPENFPFDKYELEPCSVTQYLLTNKIQCVHVYMSNSQQASGQGEPFGCLRLNSAGNSYNLFIFPYNYPRLWALLDDFSQFKTAPPAKWRQEFESYLLSIPPYYIHPLRNALKRFCQINLVPDNIDAQFSNFINNMIKKIKSQSISKTESERVINSKQQQQQQQQQSFQQYQQQQQQQQKQQQEQQKNKHSNLGKSFHHILDSGYSSDILSELIQQETENDSSELSQELSEQSSSSSSNNQSILQRNVFDINRTQLLNQLDKMKDHIFKKKIQKDEAKHHLPISQMGNYHETISKRETLRDIDDDKKPNTPLFGNPYRKEKGPRFAMSIDEADDTGGSNPLFDGDKSKQPNQNKRRRFSGRAYPTPLYPPQQQQSQPPTPQQQQSQPQPISTQPTTPISTKDINNLPINSSPPTNNYQNNNITTPTNVTTSPPINSEPILITGSIPALSNTGASTQPPIQASPTNHLLPTSPRPSTTKTTNELLPNPSITIPPTPATNGASNINGNINTTPLTPKTSPLSPIFFEVSQNENNMNIIKFCT